MAHVFDIVPDGERPDVVRAFGLLEDADLDSAERVFRELMNRSEHEGAKALCHYGMGVVALKKVRNEVPPRHGNVRSAITHLETALETIRFADAHLMLAWALAELLFEQTLASKADSGQRPVARDTARVALRHLEDAVQLTEGAARQGCQEQADACAASIGSVLEILDSFNGSPAIH